MSESRSKAWYVARRGELLVQQLLLDLGASYVSSLQSPDLGLDYLAFFSRDDRLQRAIGVEAKATEREIGGRFSVPASLLRRFEDSNLPILLVVADVKRNELYFAWLHDSSLLTPRGTGRRPSTYTLKVRLATAQERERLLDEIFAQEAPAPQQAAAAGRASRGG